MNDQQLIALIHESPIEDFTLEQIQLLRHRLAESPELQAALADRLRMDHHLADALGASEDTTDQFVQKLLQRKQRVTARSRWSIGLGLTILALFVVTIASLVNYSGNATSPGSIAKQPPASPDLDENAPPETPPKGHTPESPSPSNLPVETATAEPEASSPSVDSADLSNDSPAPPAPATLPMVDITPITFAHLTALPDAGRFNSLPRSQFDQWFAPASAALPHEIEEFREGNNPQVRLKGWFQLKGPLPTGAALRFVASDLDKLRFHFYCGDEGVTMMKYPHDYNPWYAYAMRRGEDGVQPRNLTLLTNDGYREHRSNARNYQPVALYFDEATSELVIYRGDVEVIRAPLPAKPDQIFVSGESIIRQMNLWPITQFPPSQSPEYPIQVTYDKPAELPWQTKLAQHASLEKNDDGSLTFAVDSPDNNSWICTPLPGYGMRMIDLEISHVDRSFAIFLTREDQPGEIPPPRDGIVFGKNNQTDKLFARFSYVFDGGMQTDRDVWASPSTEVGDHVWVRLFQGGGQVKGWLSRDGIHWALLDSEANNAKQYYDHLGIAAARVEGKRQLTINKIIIRELSALTGLFAESHWRQVDQVPWQQMESSPRRIATYTLPDGSQIEPDLATSLRRYTAKDLPLPATIELCEEMLSEKTPAQQKMLINELLALTKTWPLEYNQKRFLTWARDRLGQIYTQQLYTAEQQEDAAFRREILNQPTINRDLQEYLSRERVNAELLAAIEQQRWADILFSCETIQRYYHHDHNRAERDFPILNWAGGIAIRHAGRLVDSQNYLTEGRLSSLLVEDLSKEAYNISADLNAALDSGAIADACRLITQIPESAVQGLAPSASDPDHFFSVPAAIQMAVQSHQELRTQMQAEHSDLAQLRLNSAIQRGDRRVIELVTLQFFDTLAAAQAHLWLGDQATAAGDFATSLQHYLKAARSANAALQTEIDARILMLGHAPPDGNPVPTGELAFGSTKISAQALIDETNVLREAIPTSDPITSVESLGADIPAWPETSLRPTEIRWQGKWGFDSEKRPTAIREENVDWRQRNIAITVLGNEVYVSNRFELIKLDLTEGKIKWLQTAINRHHGKAHDYPYTQATPLIVGDLVLCRMLHEQGFALYAFNRQTGQVQWTSNLEGQMVLATDPIAVQGRVLIVTLKELAQSTLSVRLSHVDLATGEIIDSSDLFRIRNTWFDRGIGKIVPHQEQLLIDLGGVLASCSAISLGISNGLRTNELSFPPAIDNRWAHQAQSNLVIVGDRAISFHAGSMRIECFDVATGHLHWTLPAVTVQSISPIDEQTFLIEDDQSWQWVAVADGSQIRQISKPPVMLSWQPTRTGLIAWVNQPASEKDKPAKLVAVRIPLEGDRPTELQAVEVAADKTPTVGPSFYGEGKWYLWFSEDQSSDQRQLWLAE